VYSTSGVNDIRGGYVQSECAICGVQIRTTTDFYPYYPYVSNDSSWWTSVSHGTKDPARSRCKHWWGGGGTANLYCYYVT
jgi:hypothetical protein